MGTRVRCWEEQQRKGIHCHQQQHAKNKRRGLAHTKKRVDVMVLTWCEGQMEVPAEEREILFALCSMLPAQRRRGWACEGQLNGNRIKWERDRLSMDESNERWAQEILEISENGETSHWAGGNAPPSVSIDNELSIKHRWCDQTEKRRKRGERSNDREMGIDSRRLSIT